MFEKVNPSHPDKRIDDKPYSGIAAKLQKHIGDFCSFEKFAEWGLV